ncbi:MAG: exosortase/archaeosortase family protein, partial [Candidatus Bathyarchaeota archaeon]|nr:exosortase/archaeosortase family protein [Candidatus Bathyarchaeota archaeon]
MEKIRSELSKAVMNMKTYYQHILAAVLVIAAVLIVYGRDLEILMNEALQSEAFSHILLIPFFAGYLFYLKKDMVKASLALKRNQKKTKAQHVDAVIGIALCLIAFLVYWYGSYTFYPLEYHLISLPIFVLGITLILFNLKVLTILIFPILFLLFLTPPPTEFMYSIGGFLANFNTQASYTLLKTAGLPVELISTYGSPTLILTTSAGEPARFAIDLACSGIYSMIAFAMFAAFLALITSTSILKKIGLFALGFLLLQILNIFRITIIISIAYWFGEQIAMLIFHSITGLLLIFFGMLLTLFVAEKFLKIQILPGRQAQTTCSKCKGKLQNLQDFCTNCGRFLSNRHPKISQKFWIKLVLLPLCCSLVVLSIQAPTFAIAKGPIEVTSGWESATEIFPSKLECQDINYTLIGFTRYADFENIANQDAALAYTYFPDNRSKAVVYALVNVASSISNLHSWEVCLITWQTSHGQFP